MLHFVLKREWFEEIKAGRKTIEYREVKDYWSKRLINEFKDLPSLEEVLQGICAPIKANPTHMHKIIFRNGYTSEILGAEFVSLSIVSGKKTPLHTDNNVFAIHFQNVVEVRKDFFISNGKNFEPLRINNSLNISVNDLQ